MTTIATVPLTILADDREQAPYTFSDLGEVHVIRQRLPTGDYSLPFLVDRVCVSRKSLLDLYQTILDPVRRMRFEKELARMAQMEATCVVVEGEPHLTIPYPYTLAHRHVVMQRVRGYRDRQGWPEWVAIGGRRGGEIVTYSFLMAFRERVVREEATTS